MKVGAWLWADTRAKGRALLEELQKELGDEADRFVRTGPTLYLRNGAQVQAAIPNNGPDGERTLAVWMATSQIPAGHLSRLLSLGQCEEFWARLGTVPDLPEGLDWRTGVLLR
jgi:hypothetical protein